MDYADLTSFDTDGLLSDEAARLTSVQLQAEAELAIDLLGLADAGVSGATRTKAQRAVAMQVNHQVHLSGGAGYALSSDKVGRRSRSFRSSGLRLVSPVAAKLAYDIVGYDGWPTVERLR